MDYLLGRPDNNKTFPTAYIPAEMLYTMNGQPVWSAKHGWMLINAEGSALLCSDGTAIPVLDAGEVFTTPALFCNLHDLENRPLRREELMSSDEVRVEPVSSDATLRAELHGWYKTKEYWVENDAANRFLYSSYGAKWIAFQNFLDL